MTGGLIKQERCRVEGLVHGEPVEQSEPLVKAVVPNQVPSQPKANRVALEGRLRIGIGRGRREEPVGRGGE